MRLHLLRTICSGGTTVAGQRKLLLEPVGKPLSESHVVNILAIYVVWVLVRRRAADRAKFAEKVTSGAAGQTGF